MTTLARRPAPGIPGVVDVPVALVRGGLLELTGDDVADDLAAIDRWVDHLLGAIDAEALGGQTAGGLDSATPTRDGGDARDGSRMSSARTRERIRAIERLGRRLDAVRLRMLERAERAQVAERAGHVDTGSWVARTTNDDRRTAARDVGLALSLGSPRQDPGREGGPGAGGPSDEAGAQQGGTETGAVGAATDPRWPRDGDAGGPGPLSQTRVALDAGDISTAHARVIAQAMSDLPDGLDAEQRVGCEAELVRMALTRSPGKLRIAGRRIIEAVQPDPDEVDAHEDTIVATEEERAYQASAFWIKDNHDGTMTGHFTVPWASGALLKKVIDAMTAPRRQRQEPSEDVDPGADADALAPASGSGTHATRWDEIDWQHRRGMALADLLLRIPTDHLSPKVAATLIVSTRLEDLRGELRKVGTTDVDDSVSAGTIRRLACGAGIIPAVLDGDSLPLDLGRQRRLFTEVQRVALSTRYTECAAEGCDRPFAWCEAHHIRAWEAGGPTDLDNAVPLCGRHHRMIDGAGWSHRVRHLPDQTKSVVFHRRT